MTDESFTPTPTPEPVALTPGTQIYVVDPINLEAGVQTCRARLGCRGSFILVEELSGAFTLGNNCALTHEEAIRLFNYHKAIRVQDLEYRIEELQSELAALNSIS